MVAKDKAMLAAEELCEFNRLSLQGVWRDRYTAIIRKHFPPEPDDAARGWKLAREMHAALWDFGLHRGGCYFAGLSYANSAIGGKCTCGLTAAIDAGRRSLEVTP